MKLVAAAVCNLRSRNHIRIDLQLFVLVVLEHR